MVCDGLLVFSYTTKGKTKTSMGTRLRRNIIIFASHFQGLSVHANCARKLPQRIEDLPKTGQNITLDRLVSVNGGFGCRQRRFVSEDTLETLARLEQDGSQCGKTSDLRIVFIPFPRKLQLLENL